MKKLRYDPRALKRIRTARGIERKDVAKKAGVTVRTIQLLERGFSSPTAATLARLAEALNSSVQDFFVGPHNGHRP